MQLQTEVAPDLYGVCMSQPAAALVLASIALVDVPWQQISKPKATAGYDIQTAADLVDDVIRLMVGCIQRTTPLVRALPGAELSKSANQLVLKHAVEERHASARCMSASHGIPKARIHICLPLDSQQYHI